MAQLNTDYMKEMLLKYTHYLAAPPLYYNVFLHRLICIVFNHQQFYYSHHIFCSSGKALETYITTQHQPSSKSLIMNQPQAKASLSQKIRYFSNYGEQFEFDQQQISNLFNKHRLQSFSQMNKFIYNYPQLLLMSEPHLPTLSLFNKTPFKSRRQFTTATARQQSPFFDAIKETNRIEDQIYTSYLPYRPVYYQPQYIAPPIHLYQNPHPLEQQYLNAYQHTLRNDRINSFNNTQRSSYYRGNQNLPKQKYKAELVLRQLSERQRQIVKTPYVNHQYVPTASLQKQNKQKSEVPSKDVYLRQDQKKNKEDPQISIIQNINKSMLQTEKNNNVNVNINANISKMINDSNYMHTNQSLIIEVPKPQPKKQTVSEQVQTEQINRSSFFVETRKVKKMDQASFKKTIKDLNLKISNLNLEMQSEDIVIDLSDLVLTKDQYLEESKTILRDLQILSDERTSSGIMIKSKKQTEMIWPQF